MPKMNINELLETMKATLDKLSKVHIAPSELLYKKVTTITSGQEDKPIVSEDRPQITLEEYTKPIFKLIRNMTNLKTALATYNAGAIAKNLQERTATRSRIEYLNIIKKHLPATKKHDVNIVDKDSDGKMLKQEEIYTKPMFDISELDGMLDTLYKRERQLNTQIQKANLLAEFEVEIE